VAIIDILVPQMGEGLTEVRILEFQKKPGDTVKRDDLIYSMETDKATMEVESPYAGVLKEWLTEEGAILPIGAPIARIETTAETAESPAAALAAAPTSTRAGEPLIPPRTRAYSRQLGISEEEMRAIPVTGGKLMPSDVDNYLKGKASGGTAEQADSAQPASQGYAERPLSPQQRLFVYRLKRSAQVVIPGTIKRPVLWSGLHSHVERLRAQDAGFRPTSFQTLAFCVAQTVKDHPKFRSALIGEETIREYAHINMGIAVSRPDGELVTAVVADADALPFADFIRTTQAQIQAAREGQDQADATTQILLTYLGGYDIVDAVPVLVSPAASVLFISATYTRNGETVANLVLTFDHRLINGVEAAEFLNAVVKKVEQVTEIHR
jgi:pyruvate/2-oxoglutarate dehydrogenase complex dihydrolipoamide acyltransferase (E2) component